MMKNPEYQRKAQSLVEVALSFSIILFLMLAMIDFGFAFLHWITLRDAADEGVTYGTLHPGTGCDASLQNWVRSSASSNMIDLSAAVVGINYSSRLAGGRVTVTVTDSYHILTPMVSKVTGANLTITARASGTVLQQGACP